MQANALRVAEGKTKESTTGDMTLRHYISETISNAEVYPEKLQAMCERENFAYFDIRTIWDNYISASSLPHSFFMRDRVHANLYGKLAASRMLARFLRP